MSEWSGRCPPLGASPTARLGVRVLDQELLQLLVVDARDKVAADQVPCPAPEHLEHPGCGTGARADKQVAPVRRRPPKPPGAAGAATRSPAPAAGSSPRDAGSLFTPRPVHLASADAEDRRHREPGDHDGFGDPQAVGQARSRRGAGGLAAPFRTADARSLQGSGVLMAGLRSVYSISEFDIDISTFRVGSTLLNRIFPESMPRRPACRLSTNDHRT